MTQVTIEQAKGRLGDLIGAAIKGEEIVLVGPDQNSVRLVPVEPRQGSPRFGSAKGEISMADDFDVPLDDFKVYME